MLKQVIKEMAAGGTTGGGAITSFRGSLFGGGLITRVGKKSNKRKRLSEDTQSNFDPSDVLSKMKAAEKKIRTEDVAGFALEDEEGNLIKVYVQADQAKDFEHSLGMILGGGDDEEGSDDEEETTSMDIAEALYRLKDRFNIVDVDWGDIVGDSEEEQEVAGAPGQAGAAVGGEAEVPPEGAEGAIPAEGGTEEPGMEAGVGAEDEEGAKTALQQVIDMLKSQAEATKAEADAKKAEYDAKIAEYSAKASGAKVKQEEDILDMEDYYSGKNEETKEAKRLAKLAKWKHDLAGDAQDMMNQVETPELADSEDKDEPDDIHDEIDADMPEEGVDSEEEEEEIGYQYTPKKVHVKELSKILLRHLKAN